MARPWHRTGRAAISAIGAIGLAAGCVSGPDHSRLDAAAAREHVLREALAVEDLSAAVTLEIETGDFEGSLSGALVMAPPDRLRLRASKLLQDVFDLAIRPGALELWWFRDRVLYRRALDEAGGGGAPAEATSDAPPDGPRSFLATLDPRMLRLALCGFELARPDGLDARPVADRVVTSDFRRDGGAFVVEETLASGERLERTFDGRTLGLERVALLAPDGALHLVADYDDYEWVALEPAEGGGGTGAGPRAWLPTGIELDDRAAGVRFRMSFDDLAVNEGVLPGAFELAVPPGAEVREL